MTFSGEGSYRKLEIEEIDSSCGITDQGGAFKQTSHGPVGEIDVKRCSGGRDSHPVVDYVDLDAPTCRQMVAESRLYSNIGLLCPPGRAVLLETAAELVGLTDIVPIVTVAK